MKSKIYQAQLKIDVKVMQLNQDTLDDVIAWVEKESGTKVERLVAGEEEEAQGIVAPELGFVALFGWYVVQFGRRSWDSMTQPEYATKAVR